MPFDGPHKLLTIHGRLFGNAEQWSMGMRFSGAALPDQAMVDACALPVKTFWNSIGMNAGHTVDGIKLAPIGADGKYPPGTDSVESFVGFPAVGSSSSGAPQAPQVCLVVSLTTALPRGRAHIGRVYLPAPNFGLSSTGGMTPVNANSVLASFRTMTLSLNGVANMGSMTVKSKFGNSATVTGFRCGMVYDTQRRRRRSIPEQPVSLAL